MKLSRRQCLTLPLVGFGLWAFPWMARAKSPRADAVMWGGLGFAIPGGSEAAARQFPWISSAIQGMGGVHKLVKALMSTLEVRYPGGIVEDPAKLLDTSSDPGLLFTVSMDYEQVIFVPHQDRADLEYQVSYIYSLAQVLYFELPQSGGSDGDLRILYSFPFRVSRGALTKAGDAKQITANIEGLLNGVDQSLVATFGKKVAQRKFAELNVPKRIQVRSAKLSDAALAKVRELGIDAHLTADFFGRAFSASLSQGANASVIPYGPSDTLNNALASRFNRFPDISKVFSALSVEGQNNYIIDLTVHALLRKSNGSNIGNVLYARGMSVWIKVTDVYDSNKVVLDQKIHLIEESELAKSMFDRLQDYDQNYMVQIAISLFDKYVKAVMDQDMGALKALGVNTDTEKPGLERFKTMLLACRYD